MKTILAVVVLLLLSTAPHSLGAAGNDTPPVLPGGGTSASAVDSGESGFEINAATDDSDATVKVGRTVSVGRSASGKNSYFDTFSAAATAPLAKGGEATQLATNSGFPDTFTLTGKYTRFSAPMRNFNPSDPKAVSICDEMRTNALGKHMAEADVKKLRCSSGNVFKYVPNRLDEFDALIWDDSRPTLFGGGSGTVGHREFEFLQDDLQKHKSRKLPWGVSAFAAIIPPNSQTLFTGGVAYRKQWKDADDTTLCPTGSTSASVACKSGPGAAPEGSTQKLVFAEMRRAFLNRAFSFKVQYDLQKKQFAADLPIYILRSGESGFGGGVRIDWVESEGSSVGVFVSKVFSLFPE